METSLIIYGVVFLVVVFLIFKLIKKIMFAIFAVIFICIAIIGGIGTMAYFDYQDIVEQNQYNLNLIYGSSENPEFGISILFEDGEPNENEISSVDISEISEEFLDEIEDDFYVFIDKDLFEKLLNDDTKYYLEGTQGLSVSGVDFYTALTKDEVLDLIDSSNAQDKYVDLLLEKNDLGVLGTLGGKGLVKEALNEALNGVDFRGAIVISVISNLDLEGNKALVVGFKEEKLEIYPERFSFKFVRWLPIDTLVNMLESEEELVEEE